MENGGYMFVREQSGNNNNSNSNNLAWENTWAALNNHHSRFDLGSSNSSSFLYRNTTAETTNATLSEGNAAHALLFPHATHRSLYAGVGSNLHPDPHLMCLKLGKRHYFEDSTAAPMGQRHVDGAGGYSMVKKGKPYYTYSGCGDGVGLSSSSSAPVLVTPTATVPRCQVDGCHVALINSKDYHRRHKVCEMHSKAPKVMVLGLDQRFCQQCSRFHVVSEFDDTKRSCRRRLAGHNERRRKSSHDSLSRNSSQVNKLVSGRLRSPATGRALSLLSSSSSSSKAGSWVSSSDLSSRCSAALRELIAENRAAILARHLILDGRDWNHNANQEDHPQTGSDSLTSNHHYLYHQHQIMLTEQQQQQQQQNNWERYQETNTHVTLDLMQAPSEEEECSELWTSLDDDHVV